MSANIILPETNKDSIEGKALILNRAEALALFIPYKGRHRTN